MEERLRTKSSPLVRKIAAEHGAGEFQWATTTEARTKLWQARHNTLYAARAMRPGGKSFVTDVCVPISKLAECILETKQDLAASQAFAPLVGHVGDGNFHLNFVFDPDDPRQLAEVKSLNSRHVQRALAMDGHDVVVTQDGAEALEKLQESLG